MRFNRSKFGLISVLALILALAGVTAQAQTPLEEQAKQVISQQTGIDEKLLATLFVTEDANQFILAFVYINEEVLNSKLNPNLKEAVTPYVGKKAMLTLVAPVRASAFNPLELSFSQNDVTSLITSVQVHAITDDFLSGQVQANSTSAGIIELPESIDIEKSFNIIYRGKFTAPFSITGVVEEEVSAQSGQSNAGAGGFLLIILQFILFFFLVPFLIVV